MLMLAFSGILLSHNNGPFCHMHGKLSQPAVWAFGVEPLAQVVLHIHYSVHHRNFAYFDHLLGD
jgi:hypothetical protein